MSRNYRDLIAWQKAMDLVADLYRATAEFPKSEVYGLISQIRRAAVSVPSNIAEGQGRGSDADFVWFLWIARGSIREIETQLLISERLGYLSPPNVADMLNRAEEVGRVIRGLINARQQKD